MQARTLEQAGAEQQEAMQHPTVFDRLYHNNEFNELPIEDQFSRLVKAVDQEVALPQMTSHLLIGSHLGNKVLSPRKSLMRTSLSSSFRSISRDAYYNLKSLQNPAPPPLGNYNLNFRSIEKRPSTALIEQTHQCKSRKKPKKEVKLRKKQNSAIEQELNKLSKAHLLGFVDFKKQKSRPDITEMNSVNPNEHRYEYYYVEPSVSTGFIKPPTFDMAKTVGRPALSETNYVTPPHYNSNPSLSTKGAISFDKMRSWADITRNPINPTYLEIEGSASLDNSTKKQKISDSRSKFFSFKHSTARNPSDPRLPIFMQNMYNHLGNRSLSSQTLRNIHYSQRKSADPPEFGNSKCNLLKWNDLVRSPKTPLRMAKEYLTNFSGDEADGMKEL